MVFQISRCWRRDGLGAGARIHYPVGSISIYRLRICHGLWRSPPPRMSSDRPQVEIVGGIKMMCTGQNAKSRSHRGYGEVFPGPWPRNTAVHQGGAWQPTDSCWLVGSEILKASRVSLQAVKQRCMPRRRQHHRTSLVLFPGGLLEACSRCGPLPDRWHKVRTDIREAKSNGRKKLVP